MDPFPLFLHLALVIVLAAANAQTPPLIYSAAFPRHAAPLSMPKPLRAFYRSKTPKQLFNGAQQQQQQQQPGGGTLRPGVYSCGHQGSEMFINFVNPSYPAHDTTTGTCVFKVDVSPRICQIRVDFVDTEMLSPDEGLCTEQSLQIGGAAAPVGFERLCGLNADQHFYIHIDPDEVDPPAGAANTVDFTITTSVSKSYKFGLWLTQMECGSNSQLRAPDGCTQYYLAEDGIIKTFNFEGVQYLANQNYRACIRSKRDACFVVYQADANQFLYQLFISRDNRRFLRRPRGASTPSGRGDEDCGMDYLLIPGGRANATKVGPSHDRFCGGRLNVESNSADNIPIYSEITSKISYVQIVTSVRNQFTASLASPGNNNRPNRVSAANIFTFSRGNANNRINQDFAGVGAGMRLRYSMRSAECLGQSTTFFKKK